MQNELFEKIKAEVTVYGNALGQVGKLRLISVVSRVLGLFLMIFTVVLCALALFTFGAVAAIDAMSRCLPVWAAALIIGSAYIILIAVAILCRKQLFIHPFIALLSKQLIATEEQLERETIKAEHDIELQKIRLETRISNATREMNFYVNLFNHIWTWFIGKLEKNEKRS